MHILNGRVIKSIRGVPRTPTVDEQVAHHPHVKYLYTPGNVAVLDGGLVCAQGSSESNGAYLYGVDGLTTIVKLDEQRPLVITGRYSGCILRVIQVATGSFVCMHIYNPRGNNALLADTEAYVAAIGGRDIATMGSAGLIWPGRVDSVWFVCELATSNSIRIARITVDSSGNVVDHVVGVFPGWGFGGR